jgi:hypothetical protein
MRLAVIPLWAVMVCLGGCGAADTNLEKRPVDPGPPVAFKHKLTLTRPGAEPRELKNGDQVATGDKIWISVTPQEDVFVDIAYCDGAEFTLYREHNPLIVQRGQPENMGPLTITDGSKPEVVYVIVSGTRVSRSNPDLTIAMIRSRHTEKRIVVDGECEDGSNDARALRQLAKRPAKIPIAVMRYEFPRLNERATNKPASRTPPSKAQPRRGPRTRRSAIEVDRTSVEPARSVDRERYQPPAPSQSLPDFARREGGAT